MAKRTTAHGCLLRVLRAERELREATGKLRDALDEKPLEQVAVATKALRGIANLEHGDRRSRGIARGALRRMGVE